MQQQHHIDAASNAYTIWRLVGDHKQVFLLSQGQWDHFWSIPSRHPARTSRLIQMAYLDFIKPVAPDQISQDALPDLVVEDGWGKGPL